MNYDSHIKAYNRNNLKEKFKMFDPTSLISLPFDLLNLGLSHKQAKKNFEEQKRQYEQNMKFQREQFDYTKALNEKNFNYQRDLNNLMMQREDNAVQRRYTDLKNAGLNPLMADGQSASSAGMSTAGGNSSSHSGSEAAQIDFRELAPVFISAMLDSKRIKNEKAQTEIERERLNNQLLNDHENRLYTIARRITEEKEPAVKEALINQYNANINVLNKTARKLGLEADYLEWDLSIDKRRNSKSNETTSQKYNDLKDLTSSKTDENGKHNNPIVETATNITDATSPFKTDRLTENIKKNANRTYKNRKRRKKKWFSSAE